MRKNQTTLRYYLFPLYFFLLAITGCYNNESLIEIEDDLSKAADKPYKTENVIVVVIDGPRQSETWQSVDRKYIPRMANLLAPQGVIISEFYNHGATFTVPGHVAICTGHYESLSNKGEQLPTEPSFFQMWLKISKAPKEKAWIITSKEKLNVLADCRDVEWRNSFNPSFDTANRDDEETYQKATEILTNYQPQLVLLHFRGPDANGHAGDWDKYISSIAIADSLTYELYRFIENNDFYKNRTTIMVTNDHGRHLDNIATGFMAHGDNCMGCTHLNFYAVGPDFKKDIISTTEREQVDILPTVGELMGFQIDDNKNVMWELFK
ncbi:sulfatase-like hydrolase/transferase [Draconibacterium orientale]|uniref:sulfatase-like hydrolase/transferase n=1 Tax=Draconibacterium orientale TaxID=1168034 RepID=UPI0029C0F73A|nr:sulfatase-like hydrolase/transferase [Draconibacterium orientale]